MRLSIPSIRGLAICSFNFFQPSSCSTPIQALLFRTSCGTRPTERYQRCGSESIFPQTIKPQNCLDDWSVDELGTDFLFLSVTRRIRCGSCLLLRPYLKNKGDHLKTASTKMLLRSSARQKSFYSPGMLHISQHCVCQKKFKLIAL